MQPRSLDAQEWFVCFGRISGPLIGPQWGAEDDGDGDGDGDEHEKKEKDDDIKPPAVIAPTE